MEVSSFPFLNQESVTNTNFSSFVQETEGTEWKEIVSPFLFLDEEESSENHKSFIEACNYKRKAQAMNEYFNQFQMGSSDFDESEQGQTKRACRESPRNVYGGSGPLDHHLPEKLEENVTDARTETEQSVQTEKHKRGLEPGTSYNESSDIALDSQPGGSGSGGCGQPRRLWVKNRSKAWWEQCNHPDFPEEEFRRGFKMSKATFSTICAELDSVLTKKDTMLRMAIPVRHRVAVAIWRLATGEPLRLVSKRFGLGISTCHKLVLEVCSAIKTVLMPKFLQWPDESRLKEVKDEFELVSGIPNVGGSIYTTHVPIIAPKNNIAAYFNKKHTARNQKTSYSITVQGVVDPKGVFTDVCIGWPGSMSDDKILEKSALYQRANRGLLRDVRVVGNSGYPLMDWVLVPYTHQNLTWAQHSFNEKVGEVQRVAKEAFSRLKGRWSCLQKRTEVKLEDLPVVLGACCVLHNICEMRNEKTDLPEMKFDLFDDETVPENSVQSVSAMQARDHIAHNLLHRSFAGTSIL